MDTYQALNPDIAVKLVPVDENEMPSQMAAASAAGTLPGLIVGSSELMLAFGEEGILDVSSVYAGLSPCCHLFSACHEKSRRRLGGRRR